MTRRYTLFDLISIAVLVAALAVLGSCRPASAVERIPRNPSAPREQRLAPAAAPTRIVPAGRPCERNRWTTPRNCDPERRPHSPSDRSRPR